MALIKSLSQLTDDTEPLMSGGESDILNELPEDLQNIAQGYFSHGLPDLMNPGIKAEAHMLGCADPMMGQNMMQQGNLNSYSPCIQSYRRESDETQQPSASTSPVGYLQNVSPASLVMSDHAFEYHPSVITPFTGVVPSIDPYPGHLNFVVGFPEFNEKKKWMHSKKLNKLYPNINKSVPVTFSLYYDLMPVEGLIVRILPVFAVDTYAKDVVERCLTHANQSHPLNVGFPYVDQVIRVDHKDAVYHQDKESKRLSVTFPLSRPLAGSTSTTEYMKFMCLSSCIGGINRRPLRVIFTLEKIPTEGENYEDCLLGRCVVDVRICSCPKRDLAHDEKRAEMLRIKEEKAAADMATASAVSVALSAAPPVATASQEPSSSYFWPAKDKRKREHELDVRLLAIPAQKFSMMYQLAKEAVKLTAYQNQLDPSAIEEEVKQWESLQERLNSSRKHRRMLDKDSSESS